MSHDSFLKNVERRDFLKILSLTGIGSLIYSKKSLGSVLSPGTISNVVVVSNTHATKGQVVDAVAVKAMVDDGIKAYTGINDVGSAWKSIFPGITATSVIGLKVNTLFDMKNVGTHPQVTYAIADGLALMDCGGTPFPANNIIIFDFQYQNYLSHVGYKLNNTATGVRCFSTSAHTANTYNVGGTNVRLSTIITQQIDYLVNIAQLKEHSITGISLCMKNHFGSIDYPDGCHGNNGDPFVPAICALAPIKSKQMFCVIDALYGMTTSGPGGPVNCLPNKIIMGQDIVAVDCTGRDLLLTQGMSQSSANQATYINTAATTYSLGNNNAANINKINITNTVTSLGPLPDADQITRLIQNRPNPFTDHTNFSFYLDSDVQVQLRVIDYTGKVISHLIDKRLNSGLHTIQWNGAGSDGRQIASGLYICELTAGSYNKSIIIQKN